MDRERFYVVVAAGALLYGFLYVTAVFTAGLVFHVTAAVALATATAGVAYLSFLAHFIRLRHVANILVFLSIVCGVAAGVSLVW